MCSSQRPLAGADSDIDILTADALQGSVSDWNPRPYEVLMQDEAGSRFTVRVNAIGKNDARNLAIQKAYDMGWVDAGPLRVEEAA